MKKNEVFTFTAPNGAEVTAVVIAEVHEVYLRANNGSLTKYLCYAQNRLFTFLWLKGFDTTTHKLIDEGQYGELLADYCPLPKYDKILEAEQQKFDDDCYEALSSIGDMDF